MSVRPTGSGQTHRPAIDRASQPLPGVTPGRTADARSLPSGVPGRDDVRISDQARELQQADTTRGPAGELSADRLKQVLGRVAGGYYDQPQVRGEVVRRLSRDLT
jgi:hypothetical protein